MSDLWTYREGTLPAGETLVGYDVDAVDGSIGKIDDATNETDRAHVVVDTGWWIFGKKRLIPAGAITAVDHVDKRVSVKMTKEQIKDAPDYDETLPLDTTTRRPYDDYYSPFGW